MPAERPTPSPTYAQPADIVQAGWQPAEFFDAIRPGGSDAILGTAPTFVFVDDQGTADPSDDVLTDIDGDGQFDTALVEIYFNPTFIWTNRGAPGFLDFFSIIAHESGHGLSLAHFGKIFVTKKDAADGIQIADVKFAPKALMNALYVTGRDEIRGDRQLFLLPDLGEQVTGAASRQRERGSRPAPPFRFPGRAGAGVPYCRSIPPRILHPWLRHPFPT